MIPKRIAGANAYPGAPVQWKPEYGHCGHLAVRVAKHDDGTVKSCESAWELTPKELELLNAGGQIILYVAGWQVPVALRVEALPSEEGATPCGN